MSNFSLANSMSVSVRIYCALLVAYPRKFREVYETQMVQVFRDVLRDAYRRNGIFGLIDLWLHTFADLLVTALIERIMEGSQYMFSPKIIIWGSIASAFGGLMWLFVAVAWQNEGILPAALLLTLAGLAALHSKQGKQAGSLSWAGFALGILGAGMVVSRFGWGVLTGNPFSSMESPILANLLYMLGISVFGIGCVLIGLRTWWSEILPYGRWIPLALGVLNIGYFICMWLLYYLTVFREIDPWNPTTIPALGYMLLTFPIGILWMVMSAILAGDAVGLQSSNQPPAST